MSVAGGAEGSSRALALATTSRAAVERHSSSQLAPSPCDMVRRYVAASEIPDFHTKQQLGKVCWEALHSAKGIRSASEVGANAVWVCPQRTVKQAEVAGEQADQATKQDLRQTQGVDKDGKGRQILEPVRGPQSQNSAGFATQAQPQVLVLAFIFPESLMTYK